MYVATHMKPSYAKIENVTMQASKVYNYVAIPSNGFMPSISTNQFELVCFYSKVQ